MTCLRDLVVLISLLLLLAIALSFTPYEYIVEDAMRVIVTIISYFTGGSV